MITPVLLEEPAASPVASGDPSASLEPSAQSAARVTESIETDTAPPAAAAQTPLEAPVAASAPGLGSNIANPAIEPAPAPPLAGPPERPATGSPEAPPASEAPEDGLLLLSSPGASASSLPHPFPLFAWLDNDAPGAARASIAEEVLEDFDGWLARQPKERARAVHAYLGAVPKEMQLVAKRALASIIAVADANQVSPALVHEHWGLLRRKMAIERGWHDAAHDDMAFHAEISSLVRRSQEQRHLLHGMSPVEAMAKARKKLAPLINAAPQPRSGLFPFPDTPLFLPPQALRLFPEFLPMRRSFDREIQEEAGKFLRASRESSLAYKVAEAVYRGKTYLDGYVEWQRGAQGHPGHDPSQSRQHLKIAADTAAEVQPLVNRLRPIALAALDEMQKGRGVKPGQGNVSPAHLLRGLAPQDKEQVFRLMDYALEGQTGKKGAWHAFGEAIYRSFENLFVGGDAGAWRQMLVKNKFKAGDFVSAGDALGELSRRENERASARAVGPQMSAIPVDLFASRKSRRLTAEEAARWNQQLDGAIEDLDTAELLRRYSQDDVDPTRNAGGWIFQNLVHPVADSSAVLAFMAVPGGWVAGFESSAHSYANDEYLRLREAYPEMSREQAVSTSAVTGAAKALLDRLEWRVLGRGVNKFTRTERALEQLAFSGHRATRFGANFAGTLAANTVVETASDHLVPNLVLDLRNQDPRFDPKWGAVWDAALQAMPETALGLVLLSGVGAAHQTARQTRVTRELASSPAAMALRGYSDAQIGEIAAAPAELKLQLLAKYLPQKAPEGAAIGELIERVKRHAGDETVRAQAAAAAERQAQANAERHGIRVTPDGDTLAISTPEGQTVRVSTPEEARQIRDHLAETAEKTRAKKDRLAQLESQIAPAPEVLPADDPRLTPTRDLPTMPDGTPRSVWREQQITAELAKGIPVPAGQKPIAWFLAGGPGAGKSNLLAALKANGIIPASGYIEVNPDNFTERNPNFKEVFRAGDSHAARVVEAESSEIARELYKRALTTRAPVIYDATLAREHVAKAVAEQARAAGYELRLIALTTDPAQALTDARIRADESGRFVTTDYGLETHDLFNANVEKYVKLFDQWELHSRTGNNTRKIARKTPEGEIEVEAKEVSEYDRFRERAQ